MTLRSPICISFRKADSIRFLRKHFDFVFQGNGNIAFAQRNIFEILLGHTDIRLYLPFSDWFGTVNGQCPFAVPHQSENGKYNLISVWINKISENFLCVCCSAVENASSVQFNRITIILCWASFEGPSISGDMKKKGAKTVHLSEFNLG